MMDVSKCPEDGRWYIVIHGVIDDYAVINPKTGRVTSATFGFDTWVQAARALILTKRAYGFRCRASQLPALYPTDKPAVVLNHRIPLLRDSE